jgi:hypothetical protein
MTVDGEDEGLNCGLAGCTGQRLRLGEHGGSLLLKGGGPLFAAGPQAPVQAEQLDPGLDRQLCRSW